MADKLRSRINIGTILAVITIAIVIWKSPRFVGAFYLNACINELDAALQQPSPTSDSITRALDCCVMATIWDAANEQAMWNVFDGLGRSGPVYAAEIRTSRARFYCQKGEWEKALGEWEKALDEYREAIVLAPNDINGGVYADFDRALAGVYSIAVQREPSNGQSHYLLAKYLDRIGQGDEAIEEFRWVVRNASAPTLSDSEVGEAHYRLGLYYEDRGEIEPAMENYNKALGLNKRLIDAYARLARWYRERGEVAKAEELEGRLASLEPEYGDGERMNEDWVLLGYDLDEEALEAGVSIDIALYWLPSERAGNEKIGELGWYRAGEGWIQVTKVKNLAPNGGFEWDEMTGKRLPWGWPLRVYEAPIDNHELVIDRRNGKETTCARLINSEEYRETGFSTEEISVKPDSLYLQAGWVKSEKGGSGYLGRHEYGGEIRSRYIAAEVDASSWTHFVNVAKPGEGTKGNRLWLLNCESEGKVYFDDVLFFELEIPD